MKPYKWRTRNTSYVYVDSATGSDLFGDGTMDNPYQSLGKAWRGHSTYHPSNIVCRGRFSEDMADGTHGTTIAGDYYGAATFDGGNVFTIYGFTTPNMFINNCTYGEYDTVVNIGSPLLAGVGRANAANGVGVANDVHGVAASSVLMRASVPYFGGIGGSTAVTKVGWVSPKPNPNYPLWFITQNGNVSLSNNSFFDIPKENRREQMNNNGGSFNRSIFGKCAFFLNDGIRFTSCVFASDCTWWNGDEQFIPTGETQEAKMQSLIDWAANEELKSNTTTCKNRISFDSNCVLSDLTSEQIWNNPGNGDLTLRFENAEQPFVDATNGYKGAFPPALNIPILDNSEGVVLAWDEKTACGLISVADDKIVIGQDLASNNGEIKSKVIVTKPNQVSFSAIFAEYANQFRTLGIQLAKEDERSVRYKAGEILPIGRYVARGGDITYGDYFIVEGDVFLVSEEGTSFSQLEGEGATAVEISDANVIDNMWLRTCPTEFALIKSKDGLQAGATYLNLYDKTITYRGRNIVSGESFEAENSDDTFNCDNDSDYKIAILFDDSRVPSQPWIPAQLWGEYFVDKRGGAYQLDEDGDVIGSGTYLAWIPSSEGGYSDKIVKSRAQAKYIQLKITAVK